MLEVDAKKRITAQELVRDAYIACSDIRLTAFETAGSIFRTAQAEHIKKYGRASVALNTQNFLGEGVKDAHITAIEHLVSDKISHMFQKTIGYASKEIEVAFKEELNAKRSDIYEIYTQTVTKVLAHGKDRAAIVQRHSKEKEISQLTEGDSFLGGTEKSHAGRPANRLGSVGRAPEPMCVLDF